MQQHSTQRWPEISQWIMPCTCQMRWKKWCIWSHILPVGCLIITARHRLKDPMPPYFLHFLFLSGNKGLISGGFNGILFKCIKVNIRKKKSSTVKDLTIPLKQKRVWMFLAYVGEGAYEWDAIAEFLLILVVMSLQHGIPHLLPQTLVQLLRCHHVV